MILRAFQLFAVDYEVLKYKAENKQNHVIENEGYFNIYDEFSSVIYVYGKRYEEIRLYGDLP